MRLRKVVLLLVLIFVSAFILGYVSALYYGNNLIVLGEWGKSIPIIATIGLVLSILKLFVDWYRQPELEFCDIWRTSESVYFIKLRKKRGKGYALNCEGKIRIGDIDSWTVWALNEPRRFIIGETADLRLFSIEGNVISFPSAHLEQGRIDNERPLHDYMNRELKIIIMAENGRVPGPLTKRISEIINPTIT